LTCKIALRHRAFLTTSFPSVAEEALEER